MPFTANLAPNDDPAAGAGNCGGGGCSPGCGAGTRFTTGKDFNGDACHLEGDDFANAFGCETLPNAAGFVDRLNGVTGRAEHRRTAGPDTWLVQPSVGLQFNGTSGGATSHDAGTSYSQVTHSVTLNPDTSAPWTVEEVDNNNETTGLRLVVSSGDLTEVPSGLARTSGARFEVLYHLHAQSGVYDLVGPLLPLAALLGGVATLTRVDVRRLARFVSARTRVGWTVEEDELVRRQLRDWRRAAWLDLGSKAVRRDAAGIRRPAAADG